MTHIHDADKLARYDALADLVEELHDENMALRQAIRQTLDDNGHLADGECCTLLPLKLALRKIGAPWEGDELPNAKVSGAGTASDGLTEEEENGRDIAGQTF